MSEKDTRHSDYVSGRWSDTNPAFTASLDGIWLVEVALPGPTFRRVDRLCGIFRDGKVTGGGKFFSWAGHFVPTIGADGSTSGLTAALDVTRIAMPWYSNAWTEGAADFQIPLNIEMINPQYGWCEMVRANVGGVASYWHKLQAYV